MQQQTAIIAVGAITVTFNVEKITVRDQTGTLMGPRLVKDGIGRVLWEPGWQRSNRVQKAITKARTEAANRGYVLSDNF